MPFHPSVMSPTVLDFLPAPKSQPRHISSELGFRTQPQFLQDFQNLISHQQRIKPMNKMSAFTRNNRTFAPFGFCNPGKTEMILMPSGLKILLCHDLGDAYCLHAWH